MCAYTIKNPFVFSAFRALFLRVKSYFLALSCFF